MYTEHAAKKKDRRMDGQKIKYAFIPFGSMPMYFCGRLHRACLCPRELKVQKRHLQAARHP